MLGANPFGWAYLGQSYAGVSGNGEAILTQLAVESLQQSLATNSARVTQETVEALRSFPPANTVLTQICIEVIAPAGAFPAVVGRFSAQIV